MFVAVSDRSAKVLECNELAYAAYVYVNERTYW